MSADSGEGAHSVLFGGERIVFRLRRTSRRTLAITVQPDLGVLVTAPRKAALETVLGKVRSRAGWIKRQQRFFGEFLPQTPTRRYLSGETHRYLGRQYRLKVVEAGESSRGRALGGGVLPPTPLPVPRRSGGNLKIARTSLALTLNKPRIATSRPHQSAIKAF